MSMPIVRQPLTGVLLGIPGLTLQYLEGMRSYCRKNGYSIQALFAEDDEEGLGFVQEHVFLYIIQKKFSGQSDFSIDEVRLISAYLRYPDGNVWYMKLHNLMKSDENMPMVFLMQKTNSKVTSSFDVSTGFGRSSQQQAFTGFGTTIPQSQGLLSWSNGLYSQPSMFASAPPQQLSLFGSSTCPNTTSTGLFGSSTPINDVPTRSGGLFSTPAPSTSNVTGSFFGNASTFGGNIAPSANQTGSYSIFGQPAGTFATAQFGATKPTNPGGSSTSNGSLFGSPCVSSLGGGGGSTPNSGVPAAQGGSGFSFGGGGGSTPNSGVPAAQGGSGFSFGGGGGFTPNSGVPAAHGGSGFSFGGGGGSTPNSGAPAAHGGSGFSFGGGGGSTPNSGVPAAQGGSGLSFGSGLSPTSETPTEAAGPTLPAFTHGLSQQSTNTVTKILGGNSCISQNESALAAPQSSCRYGFGGEFGTSPTVATGVGLNGTTGVGTDVLGSGDAITKAGGAQIIIGVSEGIPKQETKQNSDK